MSDPVTNVEIEDVLSSIRRLVSDGDKARTRDPAPEQEAEDAAQDASFEAAPEPESQPVDNLTDRLVLTPAFLVVDDAPQDVAEADPVVEEHEAQAAPQDESDSQEDDHREDDHQEAQHDVHADDHHDDHETHQENEDTSQDEAPLEPFELTNMVWDAPANDDQQVDSVQTPDRSELVATIAELEAAISTDADEYEPDGSETAEPEPMAETIAWPGTITRSMEQVEDAETDSGAQEDDRSSDDNHIMQFQRSTPEAAPEFEDHPAPDVEEFDDSEPDSAVEPAEVEADVYADDDLEDLIEAGGVTLDEEALRAMVAEVVREELTGPLGERITRNVRKLVRREIYRVLSSQEFD